jgi:hypothetical protein
LFQSNKEKGGEEKKITIDVRERRKNSSILIG